MFDLTGSGWDSVGSGLSPEGHDAFHDAAVEREGNETTIERPHAVILAPVFTELRNTDSPVAAFLFGQLAFDFYLSDLLPDGVRGIHAVFSNNCNNTFSYELTGSRAIYLGVGDSHDPRYADRAIPIPFSSYHNPELAASIPGHCIYTMTLYPSDTLANGYRSQVPLKFTCIVAATFVFMICTFVLYDCFVERRNRKVEDAADRASAIVSSMFPSNVRDRLYEQAKEENGSNEKLKSFLHNGDVGTSVEGDNNELPYCKKSMPIAEFFPATTIMFGDISGE